MLNRNTNERIVCASYNDDLNGWRFIEKEIRAKIPKLPALKFSSNLGTPISCEMVNLKFLNEKVLSAEQLLPTTDTSLKKDKNGSLVTNSGIDPYAAAHEKPFLRMFISAGEDYKSIKPQVQDWLKKIGEHDEWLIVHISGKESGFFSRSIASTLRSDFVKGKIERVCSFRMFDSEPTTNLLDDVMAKIRDGVLRSGQKMISEYPSRMKALEQQRNLATFNFLSFFALKEGLALVYEALRSPEAALGIYDELELLFGQRKTETWQAKFSGFGGDTLGDDSGSLLDFTKKPYRSLLLTGNLTEFDFRQYLFSRQAHLLFLLANPMQVLSRGIKFITGFEEALIRNKCSKLFIDVWCFSAYMDLAESCKAANQSVGNDASITSVLGDVYHSAVTRLDALGSEFNFLPKPQSDFIVGISSSAETATPPPPMPEEVTAGQTEESEAHFTSPLKGAGDVRRHLTVGSPLARSIGEEDDPTPSNNSLQLPASELNASGESDSSGTLQNSDSLLVAPSPISPSVLLSTPSIANGGAISVPPTLDDVEEMRMSGDKSEKITVPLPLLTDPVVPSVTIDTLTSSTLPSDPISVPAVQITTDSFSVPKTSSSPAFSLPKPSPPRSRPSHHRNKSKSSGRTHSRNSSLGEDIDLDSPPSSDNEGRDALLTSDDSIPRILEEDIDANKSEHVIRSFPELQMALLSLLREEQTRLLLGQALHLSEVDSQMFSDPSNGAVFALTYLQAAGYIDESKDASKLLDVAKSDSALSNVADVVSEYMGFSSSHANGTSMSTTDGPIFEDGRAPSTPREPVAHSVESPSDPTALLATSSVPGTPNKTEMADSSKPTFTFTRVISPTSSPAATFAQAQTSVSSTPQKSSPSMGRAKGTKYAAPSPSLGAQPSSSSASSSSSHSVTPVIPKKTPQFQNKSLELTSEDAETLQVGNLTITHPSLSSALTNSHAFDKLYKSIALKSNAAFTAVNRSRSSIRMKNTLGNLAFSRGHYQEALKYFDDTLINVYVSEGWDRLLFSLYNKIAECYLRLERISEYCSTLLCLLFPRLQGFATLDRRSYYQREIIRLSSILEAALPISIDANSRIDRLTNVKVSILSPIDKRPLTSIKTISAVNFAMGDTITIKANVTSEFPLPIVAEKFYLTFHTTNSKTQRTRTFHVGTSNLTLVPGMQVITLNAQLTKGRWGLASYSMTFGKVTLATRYFHPIPRESTAYLQLVVTKSATNTTLKVDPPVGGLLLGTKQCMLVKIDSNQDSIKEAIITLSFDGKVLEIPDGQLKAKLTTTRAANGSVSQPKDALPKEKTAATSNPEAGRTDKTTQEQRPGDLSSDATVEVTEVDVLVRNRVIAIPEMLKNSKLQFYLPTTARNASERDDGQLAPVSRELLLDLSFRKSSNEKKALNVVVPLSYSSPLLFEHSIVPGENVAGGQSTFFVTTTVKNQAAVPITITSHTSSAEGSIVVTQDYNAALNVDEVLLLPGDFTSLLMAVVDTQKATPRDNPVISTAVNNWIVQTVHTQVTTNTGLEPSSAASYSYNIPFKAVSPLYKINARFSDVMIVGEPSVLTIDFYVPVTQKTSSPSFSAFYRLLYDPSHWVITGRTYGKLKSGTTDLTLGLVALSATSVPPRIQIEEVPNVQDARSRVIVAPEYVSIKQLQSTLHIRPQARVISACKELVES